jgi:metal-responsive CopG/Arc/MetJ family transcriptional regulator
MPTKRYSRFMKPVTKQKRIQVRVDPDLAEALKECACREKRSVSEVIRTALREYLLDRAT